MTHSEGWRPLNRAGTAFVNPRAPSVPASLDLTLEGYFAAAVCMLILASQGDEPDQDWVKTWSFALGEKMAAEERRRRKRR